MKLFKNKFLNNTFLVLVVLLVLTIITTTALYSRYISHKNELKSNYIDKFNRCVETHNNSINSEHLLIPEQDMNDYLDSILNCDGKGGCLLTCSGCDNYPKIPTFYEYTTSLLNSEKRICVTACGPPVCIPNPDELFN